MKNKSEIRSKIEEILEANMGIEPIDMREDETRLQDDLGLDSLDMVEFIMECEKHFNVVLPDEDFYETNLSIGEFEGIVANALEKAKKKK